MHDIGWAMPLLTLHGVGGHAWLWREYKEIQDRGLYQEAQRHEKIYVKRLSMLGGD